MTDATFMRTAITGLRTDKDYAPRIKRIVISGSRRS